MPVSLSGLIFPGLIWGVAATVPLGREERNRTERKWLRFGAIGIQYGMTIALFALGGQWLDGRYGTAPLWTVLLSLFGITGATISLVYQVIGKK
ncbi:MAG: AtpZ/AtpI family protein [Planctomycetota bacterium]